MKLSNYLLHEGKMEDRDKKLVSKFTKDIDKSLKKLIEISSRYHSVSYGAEEVGDELAKMRSNLAGIEGDLLSFIEQMEEL